MKIKDPNNCI